MPPRGWKPNHCRGALRSALASLLCAGFPAAAQVPAPQPDAEARFQQELTAKMLRQPYFSRASFERVDARPPYLFLVQRTPAAAGAERAAELAGRYAAALEPLRLRFEQELAQPLGLKPRADTPRLVVVILASHAEYEECERATSGAWHYETEATFARDLGAAVVYEDEDSSAGEVPRLASARHVFAHTLQQAWYGGPGSAPVRSWLFEGMADFLAIDPPPDDQPAGAASLGVFAAAPKRLQELVSGARGAAARWANLRTVEELCAVDEPLNLEGFFRKHTQDESLLPGPGADVWAAFYRQAALFYAFLHEGESARYRPSLERLLARAFAGTHDFAAFKASFGSFTPEKLQRGFLAWILAQYRRAFPGVRVDDKAFLAALARNVYGTVDAEPEASAPADVAPSAGALAPPVPAPPSPSSAPAPSAPEPLPAAPLALDDLGPDERLAWALAEIGAGKMGAARARLAELASGADPELRARIEREERRVTAFEGLRDEFLARAVAEDLTLELELGGQATTNKFRLRSAANGEVELDDKKGGIRHLAVEDLDPLALARQMGPGSAESDWKRFYLYVLRGDERWKKLLRPEGDEASALLEDARSDYPPRVHLGQALVRLQEILQAAPPATPKEIDARVAALRVLLADYGDTTLVARKRAALISAARVLLEQRLELTGPAAALGGKLSPLDDERVRITYTFDDPRELEDFDAKLYPVLAAKAFPLDKVDDQPFKLEKGKLTALGQAALRTLYDLGAPLAVRYDLEFGGGQVAEPSFYLAVGLCDDGAEHFLWAINMSGMQLLDPAHYDQTPYTTGALFLNRVYGLELRNDGKRAQLLLDGKEQCSLDAGTRQYGAVFLRASTDLPLRVSKLVIEGRLLPASFARLKRAWAERQLAGL